MPTIHYAKTHLDGSQEGYSKLIADTFIARASFSLSASCPKSPSRSSPRGARRRVSSAEGEDDSLLPVSDELDVDDSDHTSGPRVDTAGAARSGGGGGAPELSSELFDSLQRADGPLMQQLGSFLSVSVAEIADLRRRLAVSEERAGINQMLLGSINVSS